MLTGTDAPPEAAEADDERELEALAGRLVARCLGGDRDGFDELLALTEPGVRRFLGRMVGRRADLDDLVQETYLRAWRSLSGFRGEGKFRSWLLRIASNTARTWMGRARPTAPLPNDDALVYSAGPGLGERDLMEAYDRALRGLPDDLRVVFVLHESEGLSYREVAESAGCPIGTVMSRLHRARARILDALRERLEESTP